MKTPLNQNSRAAERGSALMLVALVMAVSAIILTGAMQWASTNARLSARNNEYYKAVASAEAATEKVVAMMSKDFRDFGWAYVDSRLPVYRSSPPSVSESTHWRDVAFWDPTGSSNGVYVTRTSTAEFQELQSQYVGLRGMAATYSVVANAQQASNVGTPVGVGVRQQFQLATIPIFQFAIFYGILMEIHPGPVFEVTGRVHSNDGIYFSSKNGLTFDSHVTSVGSLINGFAPGDTDHTGTPGNKVTFKGEADEKTAHLHLPIGTNNSPAAVREILAPPPLTENPNSAMGQQRFYNKSDLIITVSNNLVLATSGRANGFATVLTSNDWGKFLTITNSFRDWREEKTMRPVDINVGDLRQWSATNITLRTALGNRDLTSVYVNDQRTHASGNLGAVRVTNGRTLPPHGLTVATALPLYVQGHYNQPIDTHLGTHETGGTKPASFAADAINVLSGNWVDSKSTTSNLGDRKATDTTVNAAFLAGIVPTADSNRATDKYSGGVENYPRFLEDWGGKKLTYNGSMVVLFNSKFATNGWKYGSPIYTAPARDWAFDLNFMEPTRLPPGTPQLSAMIRGSWTVIPTGNTNTVAEATVVTIGGGGGGTLPPPPSLPGGGIQ
ncbi:MAG TPA: hypothetical protein DCY13_17260 [Verrucomicrobiales bacterium]|nr:hypothetical protein [Verrucomicrobiales bacterium]